MKKNLEEVDFLKAKRWVVGSALNGKQPVFYLDIYLFEIKIILKKHPELR